MKCKLIVGSIATPGIFPRYINLCSGPSFATNEVTPPIPTAGKIRNLYVKLLSDPDSGGSGNGYIFTVRKSGVDQAMTVSILSSTPSFQAAYTGADISYAVGDRLSMKVDQVGAPANSPRIAFLVEFESNTANESILMGGTTGANLANTNGLFCTIAGDRSPSTTNEEQYYTVAPTAGQISSFTVYLATTPGGTATRTFTLRVNGVDQTTAITYTSAQNGVKTQAETITIAAGDRISLRSDTTNTPSVSQVGWGVVFKPTVDGEFIIPIAGGLSNLNNAATRWIALSGSGVSVASTEANAQTILNTDFALKGWSGWVDVAPTGATKSWTMSLRESAVACPTPFSASITDTAQAASASATAYTPPANYTLYDTQIVPANTPTAAKLTISYIGYIAVPSTGGGFLVQGALLGGYGLAQ